MGLKIDMTEMNSQIRNINIILKQKNTANQNLKAVLLEIQQADGLTGKAYQGMKKHFQEYHLPIVEGMIAANEAIIEANQIFKQQFAAQVDPSPSARIDEDTMQAIVTQMNSLSNDLNEAQINNQNYIAASQIQLMNTQKIIEQIQKLHDFNFSCAPIYHLANQLLEQVAAGVAYLANGSYNHTTHTFTPEASASISWLKQLNSLNNVSKSEIDKIAKKIPNLKKQDLKKLDSYLSQNPSHQLPNSVLTYLRENKTTIAASAENKSLLSAMKQSSTFTKAGATRPVIITYGEVVKYDEQISNITATSISENDEKTIGQGITCHISASGIEKPTGKPTLEFTLTDWNHFFGVGNSVISNLTDQIKFLKSEPSPHEIGRGVWANWEALQG